MAAQIVAGEAESELRTFLGEYLKAFIEGKESIGKTITVMMRLWFFIPEAEQKVIDKAKELLHEVTQEERIWIHWGLILLRYPYVRDVSSIIGRLLDLQGKVRFSDIRNRIVEHWGDRSTIRRTVQMVTKTMEYFGFIKQSGSGQSVIFTVLSQRKTESVKLQQWFVEVIIRSQPAEMILFEEIKRQYFIFPFQVDIPSIELYKNKRLEITREGLDHMLVGVR